MIGSDEQALAAHATLRTEDPNCECSMELTSELDYVNASREWCVTSDDCGRCNLRRELDNYLYRNRTNIYECEYRAVAKKIRLDLLNYTEREFICKTIGGLIREHAKVSPKRSEWFASIAAKQGLHCPVISAPK